MNAADPFVELPGPGDHRLFTTPEGRTTLEQQILPVAISRCRWFGGKARQPYRFSIREVLAVSDEPNTTRLLLVEIDYPTGPAECYQLPLQIAARALGDFPPGAIFARFGNEALLFDAIHDERFRAELFGLMLRGSERSTAGPLIGTRGSFLDAIDEILPSRAHASEQSNSSIIYGERVFLKLYRRLEEGVNPDAEILRFLGTRNFPHVPPYVGGIEYHPATGPARLLALATGVVPNDGDGWTFTLRHLTQYFSTVAAGDGLAAGKLQADYLAHAARLGERTGQLHLALATETHDPDFTPEPLTAEDFTALAGAIRRSAEAVEKFCTEKFSQFDPIMRAQVEALLTRIPVILARASELPAFSTSAARTRTHGDYHLGQVLHGPNGFVIIDFEGEPASPLTERRRKKSPFRDVAGMLRSFHYAAHAALETLGEGRTSLDGAAESWARHAQETFLESWLATTSGAVFRDSDATTECALLEAFLLEKALYEVRYEVNNRPTWLAIPLRGVLQLLEGDAPSSP